MRLLLVSNAGLGCGLQLVIQDTTHIIKLKFIGWGWHGGCRQ
jgi:hypothetical protein